MLHQVAVLLIMRHDVVNVGPSTPHLLSSPFAPMVIMPDFFDDSVMNSRVVGQLHLSLVEECFLEQFETDRRGVTCAESGTMALHGNLDHYQLSGAKPHSLFPFKRVGEHFSFNLKPSGCFSAQQHAGPCHAQQTLTYAIHR